MASSLGRLVGSPGALVVSSVAHLSMAPSLTATSWVGAAPVAQFLSGPSCGQGGWGACRSKGTVLGQHVPDRFGLAAGDLDRGDLGATFAAVAGTHPLHDRPVAAVAAGGVGGLDQRPAEVVGPVLCAAVRAGRAHRTARREGRGRYSRPACAGSGSG